MTKIVDVRKRKKSATLSTNPTKSTTKQSEEKIKKFTWAKRHRTGTAHERPTMITTTMEDEIILKKKQINYTVFCTLFCFYQLMKPEAYLVKRPG